MKWDWKTDLRYETIDRFRLDNDDLPDGAFWAKASEEGIEVEDWEWFSKEYEKRNPKLKAVK